MKKIILALVLSALLILGQIPSFAEEPDQVTAVDGNVTISVAVDAPEDTPVLIFILPAITEDEEDVTAQKVQGIKTTEMLSALKVEYVALEKVSSGKVTHTCVMKDSLETGICHVLFNYLGSESCYSVGTFEHVGEDDKQDLLDALNDADENTCASIIYDDMNGVLDEDGETRLEAKEILRKSSADVAYYNTLSDEADDDEKSEKAKFHELLYNLKGEEDFDLPLLIECFNKAGVWMRLSLEEDTLEVLSSYNGEGLGKYWNIAIDENSDFASLSTEESNALLSKIKEAGYSDSDLLETDFHNGVMMALFRSVTTREDLEFLISEREDEDGNELNIYADDFAGVREIIADAKLKEYKLAELYNNVLEKNSNPETIVDIDDVEKLFTSSIPKDDDDDDDNGGGSGGRPMGSKDNSTTIIYKNDVVVPPIQPDPDPFPFKDVAPNNWAYSYIKKLQQDNVINGVSADEFAPGASVARQDFVKILIGALGIEASETASHFSDVANNSYYAPFVMAAFEKGIITGTGEDSFGVGVSIKREDAAVIIDRVLSKYGKEISGNTIEFADSEKAAGYAAESISRVAAAGIFSGDENGNFNPKANLSRAEACAILCRLAELIKEV